MHHKALGDPHSIYNWNELMMSFQPRAHSLPTRSIRPPGKFNAFLTSVKSVFRFYFIQESLFAF